MQVSNETTVHVRRPGNPKKWRAKVLCEGKIADLALVTVEDDQFWTDELLDLQFVDVPELQAIIATSMLAVGAAMLYVTACTFACSQCLVYIYCYFCFTMCVFSEPASIMVVNIALLKTFWTYT